MGEWKDYQLSDIAEIVGGGTPKTKVQEYWNGEIPWLTPRDLSNFSGRYISNGDRNISESGLNSSSAKILPQGTVLLSSRAPVGYLAIALNEITTNQGFRSLIPNAKSDGLFLFYLLKNNVEYLKSQSTGTTFGELAGSTLKSLSFLFPPLPEQKAIASVLSSLDDKIDLLHRQNKTLEAMAETLFRQWFVEPVRRCESEGGESQEDWEEGILQDVISVKGGTTPSTKEPECWDGDIYWTSPRDLSNHISVFLFDTKRKITERGLAKIGSGLLPIGTVLMSSRAPIGYLAITEIPLAINQGYIAIICDKIVSNYFIYLWCKVNMEEIKNSGNGSVFQEIAKSVFKEISITIPPQLLLDEFDKTVNPFFSKIKTNQHQIRTLEKLRDTLLPKLISGEVRVLYDKEPVV